MGEILLIAADWQLRALVRAQLLEEGYSVRATTSLVPALGHLVHSGQKPAVTIVDVQGLAVQASSLLHLWQRTGQAPLILCGGAWDRESLAQEGLPPAHVLLRPFSIGELVAQAQRVLACPGNNVSAA